VSVLLDAREKAVTNVYLSAHGAWDSAWVPPGRMTFVRGSHPLVYVTRGSHGLNPGCGDHARPAALAFLPREDNDGKGGTLWPRVESSDAEEAAWYHFRGRWAGLPTMSARFAKARRAADALVFDAAAATAGAASYRRPAYDASAAAAAARGDHVNPTKMAAAAAATALFVACVAASLALLVLRLSRAARGLYVAAPPMSPPEADPSVSTPKRKIKRSVPEQAPHSDGKGGGRDDWDDANGGWGGGAARRMAETPTRRRTHTSGW